jgi:hypothetical protein
MHFGLFFVLPLSMVVTPLLQLEAEFWRKPDHKSIGTSSRLHSSHSLG